MLFLSPKVALWFCYVDPHFSKRSVYMLSFLANSQKEPKAFEKNQPPANAFMHNFLHYVIACAEIVGTRRTVKKTRRQPVLRWGRKRSYWSKASSVWLSGKKLLRIFCCNYGFFKLLFVHSWKEWKRVFMWCVDHCRAINLETKMHLVYGYMHYGKLADNLFLLIIL